MLDLAMFSSSDPAYMKILNKIDISGDGILQRSEINAAKPEHMKSLLRACMNKVGNARSEFNLLREASIIRGEIVTDTGLIKSMAPGGGGRFWWMTKMLQHTKLDPRGRVMQEAKAKSMAAAIGRAAGKIP